MAFSTETGAGKVKLQHIVSHGSGHCAIFFKPVFCSRHQFRCVGTFIPAAEGQPGKNFPGVLHRDFRQSERIRLCRYHNSSNRRNDYCHIRPSTSLQDLLFPVHLIVFRFFFAQARQFLQDSLTVCHGSVKHFLPGIPPPFPDQKNSLPLPSLSGSEFIMRHSHRISSSALTSTGINPPQVLSCLAAAIGFHDGIVVLHGREIRAHSQFRYSITARVGSGRFRRCRAVSDPSAVLFPIYIFTPALHSRFRCR